MNELPAQCTRLTLPERARWFDASQAEMDAELRRAGPTRINLVHADTDAFPPHPGAVVGFTEAALGGVVTCPPGRGDPQVLVRVAERLGRFLGRTIDPERNVVITPGTQGGLFAAVAATAEAGESAVVSDPEYFGTEKTLRFIGADVTHVQVAFKSSEPAPDLDQLSDALRSAPRVMVFSNPHNPTGAVYSRKVLQEMANLLSTVSPGTIVIADQLYARLIYDGREFCDLASFPGMSDRCVSLFGPSKTESMTGFRVGVAIGPPAIIDRMVDLVSIMSLRAPAYSQHALSPWLDEDEPLIRQRVEAFRTLRDLTVDRLRSCERLQVSTPQGTAYVFPELVDVPVSEQAFAVALKKGTGILVNPGHQFGPGGKGHFRMCFAQDPRTWDEVLSELIATVESIG
jgi:aspartate/methionine/tyrosine aminotransferase